MSLTPRIDKIDSKYIINGSFPYWQRGGALVAINPQLPLPAYDYKAPDRFLVEATNFTGAPALVRSNNTITNAKYKTSLFLSGTFAAGCTFGLKTRIESIFAHDLVNQPTSTQIAVRSNNFQSATVYIRYANAPDNFSTTTLAHTQVFPLSTADDWNILPIENKLLSGSATNGVEVEILFNNESVVGAGTLYVSGIQMNIGETIQEFSLVGRDLVEELDLCRRYTEKSYEVDTPPGTISNVNTFNLATFNSPASYPVMNIGYKNTKRTTPISTMYAPDSGSSGVISKGGVDTGFIFLSLGPNGISGYPANNTGNQSVSVHFLSDAEL